MKGHGFIFAILFMEITRIGSINGLLSPDYYDSVCPNVSSIVTSTIQQLAVNDNVVAPSVLRLFNHDCFVQGCDASILVTSTKANVAEREAPANTNIPSNAFDAISKAKQAVEEVCPGVVSCADILALAARDAVVFLGGPTWKVPLGRRDGLVSQSTLVGVNLPSSSLNSSQLADNFAAVGLDKKDLVVLSGAHTIGFASCDEFSFRLYNFNNSHQVDPSMEKKFAQDLQSKCPANGRSSSVVPLDSDSPFKFDIGYYKNLQNGKGLLFTDQVLFIDESLQTMVNAFAASQDLFFEKFAESMVKMSLIGIKADTEGEIRRDCSQFNSN